MSKPVRNLVGIDLGTTNTCYTRYTKTAVGSENVEVVDNVSGKYTTPSMVTFTETGEVLVGEPSKEQMATYPVNTLYNAKRLLNTKFSDIGDKLRYAQFHLVEDPDSHAPRYEIVVNGKKELKAPEEVSALVLGNVKLRMKDKTLSDIVDAVITVPAYFDDQQREATKNAATIAGINVLRIVAEPTAAAVAYKYHSGLEQGNVFVFDFGGGTLDTSVIKVDKDKFTVLGVSGDCELGGEDIDNLLVDFVLQKYKRETGVSKFENPSAMALLKRKCEEAKCQLAFDGISSTNVIIPSFCGGKDLNVKISKTAYVNLLDDILEKIQEPIEKALENAGLEADDITQIIMIGGSSKIPAVVETVSDYFDDRLRPMTAVHPDQAVAIGACYIANNITRGGKLNEEILDAIKEGRPIPRPKPKPIEETGSKTTSKKEEEKEEENYIEIVDVNPLSIGIQSGRNRFVNFIKRSSPLPQSKEFMFTTSKDDMETATVRIFQGESEDCRENILLGQFDLTGLPKGPKGSVFLTVKIDVSEECIVKVTATCKDSKSVVQTCTINSLKGGMKTAEMERAIEEHKKIMGRQIAAQMVSKAGNNALSKIFELETRAARAGSGAGRAILEKTKKWTAKINGYIEFLPNTVEEADGIVEEIGSIEAQIQAERNKL